VSLGRNSGSFTSEVKAFVVVVVGVLAVVGEEDEDVDDGTFV
jgi:hypothetical protein